MRENRARTFFLLSLSFFTLTAGGHGGTSALRERPARELPPQVFDMRPYDDVFEIEADELQNYLNFEGSRLNPIIRIKVSCFCKTNVENAPTAMRYQDLWYRGGDAVGLKGYAPLPAADSDRVAILLKPRLKPYSDAEISACAAALVRMRLALSLNRNSIETVRVPAATLDNFVSQLRRQNFIPYKELRKQLDVLIPIPLESDMGAKVVTCFVGE